MKKIQAMSANQLPDHIRGGMQLKEAAAYLGLSQVTVRRLVNRGLLKRNLAVRHLLFSVKELNRFLEETET